MKTAEAGDLVANLGSYNWRRFFRKHWSRVFDVFVASTIGFSVQNTVVWGRLMPVSPETVGHIDHESGQMRGIGHFGGCDVHAVFPTPVWLSLTDVTLEVDTESRGVHA
jgi:hypothetical protein